MAKVGRMCVPVQEPELACSGFRLLRLLPVAGRFLGRSGVVERIGVHVCQVEETAVQLARTGDGGACCLQHEAMTSPSPPMADPNGLG